MAITGTFAPNNGNPKSMKQRLKEKIYSSKIIGRYLNFHFQQCIDHDEK
jgi:hypothetical protein